MMKTHHSHEDTENVDDYGNDDDDIKYFKVDVLSFPVIYRFLFLISSITATFLSGFPYCFCLFYIFLNVDVVEQILLAIRKSGQFCCYLGCILFLSSNCVQFLSFIFSAKHLFFLALIGASIMLVFAMGAFLFTSAYFEAQSALFCNSLWECFITVLREGLLGTLGLVSLQKKLIS